MKKHQIESIMDGIKRQRNDQLIRIKQQLESIAANRRETKRMYFWPTGMSAKERRANEEQYGCEITVKLGRHTLNYMRDYKETTGHVRASDTLTMDGEKATLADTQKIVARIDSILADRLTRETGKEGKKS